MTPEQLRREMFQMADQVEDAKLRGQLRQELDRMIKEGEYTEEYWLQLIDQMIEDGELLEGLDEEGNLVVFPKE